MNKSRLTSLLSDKDKEIIMQKVFGDDYKHADGAGVLGKDSAVSAFAGFLNGEYSKNLNKATFFNSYVVAGIRSRYL